MEVNQIVEVNIIDYDHLGYGVAKVDGFPIFIPYAIKGEIVKARIDRITKNLAEATLIEVIKESEHRNKDLCKNYFKCGGCSLMHLNYDEQLRFKKFNVKNTMYRIGGIETCINDVVPNPNKLHYRNKIVVPLGLNNGEVISGFYEHGTHNIIENDECLIEHEKARVIISFVKKQIKDRNLSVYNEINHSGLMRNIMLRVNNRGEYMVVYVVKENNKVLLNMAIELAKEFSFVKSVYACINEQRTNVILKGKFIHLLLDKYLIENINGLKFVVHPNSFLQVNHDQCEVLYNKAISYIPADKNQNVIDAYCGVGTITLNLAKKAKHVYGIEIVKEAIDNANVNKELNQIDNVTFICGKCEDEIKRLANLKNIDYILMDPARKGADVRFLDTIIEMNIKNIVYISCLPQSLARDAKYLISKGYVLKEITPFDMFSQSDHIENVAYFTKI